MAGSRSNGDNGPGGGAGANAYGMQDEPEIRLPREVSRSYNARVLDPSTVVLNQHDGKWRAYIDTTKDNLKNAPKFTYKKMTQ